MKAEISWKEKEEKIKSGKIGYTFFPAMIVLGSLEDTLQKSQGVIIVSPQACPQKWRRKTKKKNLLLQNSHKKRSTKALPWNLWSSENVNNSAKISWKQICLHSLWFHEKKVATTTFLGNKFTSNQSYFGLHLGLLEELVSGLGF